MKTPRFLKEIKDADVKLEIEEMITEALGRDYIGSYPIEDLTVDKLDLLAEYAKANDILVTLKAEHSNVHQGVLVSLVRKDVAAEFIKYL